MCARINAGTRAKLSFKLTTSQSLLAPPTLSATTTKEMHIRIYRILLAPFATADYSLQKLAATRKKARGKHLPKRRQHDALLNSKAVCIGLGPMRTFLNAVIKISCTSMLAAKLFPPTRRSLRPSWRIGPEAINAASMSLSSVLGAAGQR